MPPRCKSLRPHYILSSHPTGVHTNELSLFVFISFLLSIVGLPGFSQEYNVNTNPKIVVTTAIIIRFFHLIARMNASTFITSPFLLYQILYWYKKGRANPIQPMLKKKPRYTRSFNKLLV
jgi:hypothetical protein